MTDYSEENRPVIPSESQTSRWDMRLAITDRRGGAKPKSLFFRKTKGGQRRLYLNNPEMKSGCHKNVIELRRTSKLRTNGEKGGEHFSYTELE